MEESDVLEIQEVGEAPSGEESENVDSSTDYREEIEEIFTQNQVDSELVNNTCIVICDYVPKIYVSSLFLLGALVFAFIYKLIQSFTNHFV